MLYYHEDHPKPGGKVAPMPNTSYGDTIHNIATAILRDVQACDYGLELWRREVVNSPQYYQTSPMILHDYNAEESDKAHAKMFRMQDRAIGMLGDTLIMYRRSPMDEHEVLEEILVFNRAMRNAIAQMIEGK